MAHDPAIRDAAAKRALRGECDAWLGRAKALHAAAKSAEAAAEAALLGACVPALVHDARRADEQRTALRRTLGRTLQQVKGNPARLCAVARDAAEAAAASLNAAAEALGADVRLSGRPRELGEAGRPAVAGVTAAGRKDEEGCQAQK